jgi:hypothetical protein
MAQAKPGDLVVFNMDPVIITGGEQDGYAVVGSS